MHRIMPRILAEISLENDVHNGDVVGKHGVLDPFLYGFLDGADEKLGVFPVSLDEQLLRVFLAEPFVDVRGQVRQSVGVQAKPHPLLELDERVVLVRIAFKGLPDHSHSQRGQRGFYGGQDDLLAVLIVGREKIRRGMSAVVDAQGLLLRVDVAKNGRYEVADRYDVAQVLVQQGCIGLGGKVRVARLDGVLEERPDRYRDEGRRDVFPGNVETGDDRLGVGYRLGDVEIPADLVGHPVPYRGPEG